MPTRSRCGTATSSPATCCWRTRRWRALTGAPAAGNVSSRWDRPAAPSSDYFRAEASKAHALLDFLAVRLRGKCQHASKWALLPQCHAALPQRHLLPELGQRTKPCSG